MLMRLKKLKIKLEKEEHILKLDNPLKKSITVSKTEVIIFTLSSFLTIFSLGIVLFEFILSDNEKNNFDYQNASLYEKKMNDSLMVNLTKTF